VISTGRLSQRAGLSIDQRLSVQGRITRLVLGKAMCAPSHAGSATRLSAQANARRVPSTCDRASCDGRDPTVGLVAVPHICERLRGLTGVVCLAFLGHVPTAVSQTARGSDGRAEHSSCQERKWSRPKRLAILGDDQTTVARWPYLAVAGRSIIVAGTSAQRFESEVGHNDLVLWQLRGDSVVRQLKGPSGGRAFAFPRALEAPDGSMFLLWGEAEKTGLLTARDLVERQSSIWWARRNPAGQWSSPQRLLSAISVQWQRASLLLERDGRSLSVAVGVATLSRGRTIDYFRFDGRGWTSQEIPNSAGADFPSLVEGAGEDLFLAFFGADDAGPTNGRAILVSSSHDSGATWGEPAVVSRMHSDQVYYLAAMSGSRGLHYIVWSQAPSGQTSDRGVLRLIKSPDGGRSWSQPAELHPQKSLTRPQAALDSCGVIHVVFSEWPEGVTLGSLRHAQYDTAWSSITNPVGDMPALDVSIAVDSAGVVHLVFIEALGSNYVLRSSAVHLVPKF
jgi:hypothetical protein